MNILFSMLEFLVTLFLVVQVKEHKVILPSAMNFRTELTDILSYLKYLSRDHSHIPYGVRCQNPSPDKVDFLSKLSLLFMNKLLIGSS